MAIVATILKNAPQVLAAAILAMGAMIDMASAQSLKELRARETEERMLAREISYTQSVCGHEIRSSIDWASAVHWPPEVSLAASCDGALGAVESYCRGRLNRRMINRFVCAGDGAGATLRGGALRYGASPGANSYAETMAVLRQSE